MRVGACIAILWIPVHFLLFLAPSGAWAAVWLVPASIFAAAPFGIAAAAIQQMMPNPMRGQASGVYLFILNLIGLGIGPTAVGATTQYLFHRDAAVGYSKRAAVRELCLTSPTIGPPGAPNSSQSNRKSRNGSFSTRVFLSKSRPVWNRRTVGIAGFGEGPPRRLPDPAPTSQHTLTLVSIM